jgi:outer membrane protein assembly factor BamD
MDEMSTIRSQTGRRRSSVLTRILACGMLLLSVGCASADPYLGLSGDQLWDAGLAAYDRGDWEDAITAFQQLLNQNPGHPRTPEARMNLGRAYAERGEYISAAAEFERFLEIHFNHGLAPEASLELCRAFASLAPIPQRDQTYTRRARDACLQTEQEFRALSVAAEAEEIHLRMVDELAERAYQNARFYQRRGLHNSAILNFEGVAGQYPDTEWAPLAILGMYRSYLALGWQEEAEETATRLLARYPDSAAARELRDERGGGGVGTPGG